MDKSILLTNRPLKTNKLNGAKKGGSGVLKRQQHHRNYGTPDEEFKMPVRKGEHDVLTRLRRYCRKQMTEEFALNLIYEVLDAWMKDKIIRRTK